MTSIKSLDISDSLIKVGNIFLMTARRILTWNEKNQLKTYVRFVSNYKQDHQLRLVCFQFQTKPPIVILKIFIIQ